MREPGLDGLSKLPREDAYWASLEARVVAAVAGEMVPRDGPAVLPWHAPLTRRAWGFGVIAAAAGLALLLLPPRAEARPGTVSAVDALVAGAEPPALAALLLVSPSGAP